MGKWNIEMAYGINFSAQVRASSRDEAIAIAKTLVKNGTMILASDNAVNESGMMFQGVTFAKEN